MTPDQAMDIGSHLIHLLTQQRLLYRQLRELAQKQSGLVDGSNPEMLLRVLATRQRIIDRLRGLDRELKPIRDEWQQIAQSLPAPQRQKAQKLVEEVQEILSEIITGMRKTPKLCPISNIRLPARYKQRRRVSECIRHTPRIAEREDEVGWIR